MNIIGVIPARYASSRFPGKPLKLIAGKPLVEHVVRGALSCRRLSRVIVATDHDDIAKIAEKAGADVAMTPPELPSGSDRVWAAVKDHPCDAVLNIQGDEPLITAEPLEQLCGAFEDKSVKMATLAKAFKNHEDFMSPHIAKIVVDKQNNALYFSRLPIPHTRNKPQDQGYACLKHIGLYAYTKDFLGEFCAQGPVPLENAEALEQLRALWMGYRIRVILTNFESWGVDTPEDVIKVEKLMANRK